MTLVLRGRLNFKSRKTLLEKPVQHVLSFSTYYKIVTKLVTWHFVCLWLIEIRHFRFVLKKESGYNLSRTLYRNLKRKPPFWLKTLDVSTNFTRVIFFVISDQNSDSVLIMSRKPGQKNPNCFPYCIKAKFLYFLHLKSDQIK